MSEFREGSEGRIPPVLQELLDLAETDLLRELIMKDQAYFMKLLEMDKDSLEAEVDRLEKATEHYSNSSMDDLDYHWPASAKRAASEGTVKLSMARKMLRKYDAIQ